jgi:2-polyprenyl-3-methyl-5-hydroxy-6-metoxy-1,4-benzoquinol methylase
LYPLPGNLDFIQEKMLNDFKCPICLNDYILRSINREIGGIVVECAICGHLSLYSQLDELSIISQYEKSAIVFSKDVGRALFDNLTFKLLKKSDSRRNLSVLDVGCGLGEFMKVCDLEKYKVVGIEVTKDIVEQLLIDGFEVYQNSLEEFANSGRQFDWVTCLDVIEHLKDPLSSIKALASLVKPNGRLAIQTPNGNAIAKYWGNAYGLHVDQEHLHFYKPDQLIRLFGYYGFSLVYKFFFPAAKSKIDMIKIDRKDTMGENKQKPYRSTNKPSGFRLIIEKLPPFVRGPLRSIIQIARYIGDISNNVNGTSHGFIIVLKKQ